VFNALLYRGLPDLKTRFGMPRMAQIDSSNGWFYPKGTKFDADLPAPDAAIMRSHVGAIGERSPDGWHFLDFEEWARYPWSGESDTGPLFVTTRSAWRWGATAARWRAALETSSNREQRFGFYDIGPSGEYWITVRAEANPRGFRRWLQTNDIIASQVTPHVDFLAPSCYTFYDSGSQDRERWVAATIAVVQEARRVAPGKPVYPFIWPQFHPSAGRTGEYLPVEFWRLQLDTVRKLVDGVIIWGGYDVFEKNVPYPWDEEAPWWRATVGWLKSIKP
jgi:hypothetical protein